MSNKNILTPKEIENEADFLRERVKNRQQEQRKVADQLENMGHEILNILAHGEQEDLESLHGKMNSISSKIDNLTEEERFDDKRIRELEDMLKEYR